MTGKIAFLETGKKFLVGMAARLIVNRASFHLKRAAVSALIEDLAKVL